MKSDLQSVINQLIQAAKEEGVREFLEAAQQGRAVKPTRKARVQVVAKPGRKAKKTVSVARAPKAAQAKAAGGKRSESELQELSENLLGYIGRNPGEGAEAIGRALGVGTDTMRLPIKKLIASGALRVEGQKRATRYYSTAKANGVRAEA